MIKKILTFSLLLLWSCASLPAQTEAAYRLIERMAPGYSKQFLLEQIPAENGADVYEIGSKDGKVLLRGNNPVAMATAFNQYLKYTCNAHVSWMGDHMDLPRKLPLPEKTTRNTINGKYRVYFNYCTLSYSAAWWDWERWQREIDYMAMNSINTPLSVIGLEAVWYNTLLRFKFTDEEARSFLAGPAHFAWQWMQNLQSYGGPLPMSWIQKHIDLGRKIIDRQLELGMRPIQQGFSGYVPRELKDKYPEARIKAQPSWCGFQGAAQLDPTDPLFQELGRAFLEEEQKLFGTHGLYAADPFHESAPPVNTPEYLNAVGKSIDHLFRSFDPSSIWVMQAWSLREPIVKAVAKERLLILDLNGAKCQKANAFWGYPAVAGNLHNFGGRVNMHGDMHLLASNQYANAVKKSPNICGSGLFMEAIEQNPLYYELAFEMPLHRGQVNLDEWLRRYAERRYGLPADHSTAALQLLIEGPYRPGTNGTERSSIIAARPAVNVKKSGPNTGLGIPYDPQLLLRAQEFLLRDARRLKSSDAYRFDIVDLQRQIQTNLGQAVHKAAANAFKQGDREAFRLHSGRFLQLLLDTDELLRTRREFNFDRWITEARSWGDTPEEKNLFERDATTLVTIWGPDEKPLIFDYSWREWTGLIANFYYVRWKKFYDMLDEHLEKGIPYSEENLPQVYGREAFRANSFYEQLADWEMDFTRQTEKARTPLVKGDELKTVKRLYATYSRLAQEYYSAGQGADKIKKEKTYENLGEK